MKKLISNKNWLHTYNKFIESATTDMQGYTEVINFNFSFDPVTDYRMSNVKSLFNAKKAAKMFFWYRTADAYDKSIINYFPEYKNCIDNNHDYFNSNYGLYAYKRGGLAFCIDELIYNYKSRRACFCINNNNIAMANSEIDKLCTNTIQFFIRDARLEMVVQMRSSNFIKLLPYDAFMFSIFYLYAYKELLGKYELLRTGKIHMQIASLHFYKENLIEVISSSEAYTGPSAVDKLIDFNKDIDYTVEKLTNLLKAKS